MYVESVPNRSSPPAVLLRESYREHGKVKKRTLANLSKWPTHLVEGLRVLLKGGFAVTSFHDAFDIVRSQPHGHVAALRAFARKIGLDHLLGRRSRMRDLALALILSRLLSPASKLATARGLHPDTLRDSLADVLELDAVDENDLYAAMDWLRERQDAIEQRLATQHLAEGSLVLCDLTSSPWKAAVARWPSAAIPATSSATACRSSSACCAIATAVRWPSRSSRATPPIRAP